MRDDDKTDLPGWLGLRSVPDFTKARWLGPALSVVVIVLFGMAVLVVFAVLGHALFDFGMDDVPRIGFGTGAVAVALIGAPFVIWRSVVAQKTVNVTEQGHITDRINTAVQGLGAEKTVKRQRKRQTGKLAYATGEDGKPDYAQPIMEEVTQPNLEVRIGAIYALERIAQDSDRDHVQIMEILCAYIRQNAPAPAEDDWPKLEMKKGEEDGPLESDWKERLRKFRKQQEAAKAALKKPREDIQVALTVIGRRSPEQRKIEAGPGRGAKALFAFDEPCPEYGGPDDDHDRDAPKAYRELLEAWNETLRNYEGYQLDLRGADLRGADLNQLDLKGAKLHGTYLQGADLVEARLQGARLVEARLQGAGLWEARLQGAGLVAARLQGANLGEARLQGAHLGWARLQGAGLWEARLQRASLRGARLQGASLRGARLQGASLVQARLQGANLVAARLDKDTALRQATLRGAAVREVDFTNIHDMSKHVQDMFGDASVTLPGGHGPEHESWPAHWPKFELGDDFFGQWQAWLDKREAYRPPDPSKPDNAA